MKSRVKDGFASAQDLFLQVFNAYLVAAFMHWSGMAEIHSSPTNVSTRPSNGNCGKQEKLIYPNNVIGSFVDSFCLKPADAKEAIDRQREQQQGPRVDHDNSVSTWSAASIASGLYIIIFTVADMNFDYFHCIFKKYFS